MGIPMLRSKNIMSFVKKSFTCVFFSALACIAFSANDDIRFTRIVCKDSSEFYMGDYTYDYPIGGTPSMVKGLQNALFSKGKKFYENECHPDKYVSPNELEEDERFLAEEIYSSTVAMQTSKFILYNNFYYEYRGGAHGLGGTAYALYTKPNGQLFEINETDYKDPQKARSILWNSLTRDMDRETLNELHDYGTIKDSLPISKNIYYEKDSLSFEYMIYEIGPYACGQVQIKIPYEVILRNIKPEKARILEEIQDSFK